jgi:hypothetical protein
MRIIWLQWRQSRWWWASLAMPSIITGI